MGHVPSACECGTMSGIGTEERGESERAIR